jgi:DNA-binding CsgD family transcriptional regulator
MERLRQSDLCGALQLVGECESATGLDSFGRAVLGVTRLVPGAVAFNEIDLAKRTATALRDPTDLADPNSVEEFARLAHQNPLVVHGRPGEPPRAISDMLSARSFRALEIYDVIFKPYGFGDQIAVHLRAPSLHVAGIAINRERRGFSQRDRALLEMLAPHLSRAYLHALERERSAALRKLLENGLAQAGTVAVVVSPDGEVDRVDGRGEELLSRFFGPPAPGDRLPRDVRSWLASAESARQPLVVSDGTGRSLAVRLLECEGPPRWRAILLDEWAASPAPDELRVLGLTDREAETLAWVARGRSDLEIAALLSISPRTVDKHLENVFRKLAVHSRAEAVARAMARRVGGT